MSLTGELNRRGSWVNGFFKSNFPGVVGFAGREGSDLKSLEIKIPTKQHDSARLVGTAFDYRLRMHFGAGFADSKESLAPWRKQMLLNGIARLTLTGSGLGSSTDRKWAETTAGLLEETSTGDGDMQAKVSIVLAWLDWGFRSRGKWSDGLRTIAKVVGEHGADGWEALVAPIDRDFATEAAEVAEIMELTQPPRARRVDCGVVFDGSGFVGGGDADLILDGCLYDVKTTEHPRRDFPVSLRQLIGYALLDWSDTFGLKSVGFYFARQGAWMSWNLRELIRETALSGTSLDGLREAFCATAQERNPRALARMRRRARAAPHSSVAPMLSASHA